jgi:hypothetical protein
MAKMLFPDARFRSPTAAPDRSDVRDEQVYSAFVIGDSAVGQSKVFTVPQGQTIPKLGNGTSAAHQTTYTALHTNLSKAGEFGSALGDASVRGIGVTIEHAGYVPTTGVPTAYGATGADVYEILSKLSFALRIGGKKQIEGPVWQFPAFGGVYGAVSTTANAQTVDSFQNGMPGTGRRLKIPILIARTDTVEGEFNVTGTVGLQGVDTETTLVWASLLSLIKGDVR